MLDHPVELFFGEGGLDILATPEASTTAPPALICLVLFFHYVFRGVSRLKKFVRQQVVCTNLLLEVTLCLKELKDLVPEVVRNQVDSIHSFQLAIVEAAPIE